MGKMCESSTTLSLPESSNNALEHVVPPFSEYYKYSGRTMAYTQEKNRELFLQKQKEKRSDAFDEKRDLSELFGDSDETPEPMEYENTNKPKRPKKFPFGFKLQRSEWFTEIPEDLSENWLVKFCPEGVRYLVVANRGITTCYFRNGRQSFKFKSKLPGGNADCAHRFTVLDCIYNKSVNTLFVYDVLAWNSTSLLNAEAHMRFCWIKSKFYENPDICQISKAKNFSFVLMEFSPAGRELVQDHLFSPFCVPYDGVLFYHKEGHYVLGHSPLVCWLKTFMLPELLHIDVHPSHTTKKPIDYESIGQFLNSKKKRTKERATEDDSALMEMESVTEVEIIECDNV